MKDRIGCASCQKDSTPPVLPGAWNLELLPVRHSAFDDGGWSLELGVWSFPSIVPTSCDYQSSLNPLNCLRFSMSLINEKSSGDSVALTAWYPRLDSI